MKKSEIKVGSVYVAKVNGSLTRVRVDSIRETSVGTSYGVTNLKTNRQTSFRSAAKFRNESNGETVKAFAETHKPQPEAPVSNSKAIADAAVLGGKSHTLAAVPASILDSAFAARAAAPKRTPNFSNPPTPEQQELIDAISGGLETLVVEAGAGTGKTTSLRMLVEVLEGNGQYTAFNKSLVTDSAEKFQGTRCACNTTHSLAFRAEGKRFAHRLGGQRQRSEQTAKLIGLEAYTLEVGKDEEGKPKERRLAAGFLMAQVNGAIGRFCQSADREISESHFKYLDGLDSPTEDGRRTYDNNTKVREYLLPFARKAWADISNPEGSLPFTHDYYVKLWQLNNPVVPGDYGLLDEAQDTAPVMLDIIAQQVARGMPWILVGDAAQQIYEWRGAVNALAAFPDAPRKFLSQSFRFGQAIADVANAVLETLDEGTPLRLRGFDKILSTVYSGSNAGPSAPLENPACILCRTNAVAVATLLAAIAEGKRPFLVGGGADVIKFVRAAMSLQNGQATEHPDLGCFSSWTEVQEYVKEDEGEDLRLLVKLIDDFGAQTILTALESMPKEEDADLTISTAHKSKGRQWTTVRLAQDFPTKSKSNDADRKLLYVAVTRAQHTLDVSQCPFFTGQDSLDVSYIAAKAQAYAAYRAEDATQAAAPSVVPATPAAPPAAEQFTWSKRDGSWLARGPKGKAGQTVDIYRKDGSRQAKRLGLVVEEFEYVALYRVS